MRPRSSVPFRWAVVLALAQAGVSFAADPVYAGSLQRVTKESLTLRLDDGTLVDAKLPNKGDLTAGVIAARYHLADQLQITCKSDMELKQVRFLRAASQEEQEEVIASISSIRKENLLSHPDRPARAAQDPTEALSSFEHARKVNLERAANMPSFIADENVKRSIARKGQDWRRLDTIESEVTFRNGEPVRQNVRIDGKPWNRADLPGGNWSVDFGTELNPLFSLDCPNTFRFDRRQEARGKQILAFRFTAPPDSCFGYASDGRRRYIPARTGRILLDDATGYLIQYEEEAREFPKGFFIVSFKEVTRWEDVEISGDAHLLPVGYEFYLRFANGEQSRVSAEFKNHRQFQASTNITFQQ